MTAPAGRVSLAQERLRQSLAAGATWRKLCGATNAKEALEHIYHFGLPEPANGKAYDRQELQSYRPHALVWTVQQDGFTWTREASGPSYGTSGKLVLHVQRESPDAEGDKPTADVNLAWLNLLGPIGDELFALGETSGYLDIGAIMLVDVTYCPPSDQIETEGFSQAADFLISWG